MWWTLIAEDDSVWYLWCTYGMSGRWTIVRPDKHIVASVVADWNDEAQTVVSFYDPRHFGTLKFVNDEHQHQKKLASLGFDMLSSPPNDDDFCSCLSKKSSRSLAETLMDQSLFAGVGNYIKSEALYRARLSPNRTSKLSKKQALVLRKAIIDVMQESYAAKGATIQSYKTATGHSGGAQFSFQVYSKKTDPLSHPVTREETKDGRTTHWCPLCQK